MCGCQSSGSEAEPVITTNKAMARLSHSTWRTFYSRPPFDELIQLRWSDWQMVREEIVALRIKGKGSVFQDVPVPGRLSAALLDWKDIQERFKARRIRFPGGIAFAASQFVFAGYSGEPFFQSRVQFAAASRLQGARGGRDYSPRASPQRGDDPP
jgi:integrase